MAPALQANNPSEKEDSKRIKITESKTENAENKAKTILHRITEEKDVEKSK